MNWFLQEVIMIKFFSFFVTFSGFIKAHFLDTATEKCVLWNKGWNVLSVSDHDAQMPLRVKIWKILKKRLLTTYTMQWVCMRMCVFLLCFCRVHWSWGNQPYMERCRWCHCLSTQGPTPPLNMSSLCYTLRRALCYWMIQLVSWRAKWISVW